jgi:uncharacterized protein (TIGR02270 family)
MSSPHLQRPIGFSPNEISALINEVVVEQHAEEGAFLWMLRDRAVFAPNYSLADLAKLDERLEAHLDGLRVAGDFGIRLCQLMLEKKEPGEVFVAGVLAFDRGDSGFIEKVLAFSSSQRLARGLISALGWLPFNRIKDRVQEFLTSDRPAVRRVGIAASTVHRVDPGDSLRDAISDSDPFLRARALHAAGELGRLELLPKLRTGFTDADDSIRFGAAWSATRLSQNLDSLAVLRKFVESAGSQAYEALQIVIRRMDLATAKLWQGSLAKDKDKLRLAVIAAGAIGDPLLVSWIIEQANFPSVARLAGEAFSMITGADLAYEDLDGGPPANFEVGPNDNPEDEDVSMDTDENLRWPLPPLLTKWWNKHRARFQAGRRYLRGKEITAVSLRDALVNGTQRQRAAAALEIALRDPTRPLFEIRARGQFQLVEMNKWS